MFTPISSFGFSVCSVLQQEVRITFAAQGMALMHLEELGLFLTACRSDCPAYTYS